MTDTYEILQPDGTVREFRADQFAEIRRVRSREEHAELVGQGWLPLDEEVEEGDVPKPKAAWKEALLVEVTPPEPAPQITVFVLGRLKPGEEGVEVV